MVLIKSKRAEYERIKHACRLLLEFAPEGEVDTYAMNQMENALLKYLNTRRPHLSEVMYAVNRYIYPTLFHAFHNVEKPKEIILKFKRWEKTGWRYDVPTRVIKINENSRGGFTAFASNKRGIHAEVNKKEMRNEIAMFRIGITHWFYPESITTVSKKTVEDERYPPPLMNIQEFWQHVRSTGVIPFQIRLCAYTKSTRVAFNIDLLRNRQLRDFRDGKVGVGSFVARAPIHLLYLDRALSSPHIPDLQKRVLEVVFESKGMGAGDIAHIFDIPEKMARNHLEGLVKKGLLKAEGKPPAQFFVADLENIEKTKGEVRIIH